MPTAWLWSALGAGSELLRGLSPAFCPACPWGLVGLLVLLACCLGCCLGASLASIFLSPLLRRACLSAGRILLAGLQAGEVTRAAPDLRRLSEYRQARSVRERDS